MIVCYTRRDSSVYLEAEQGFIESINMYLLGFFSIYITPEHPEGEWFIKLGEKAYFEKKNLEKKVIKQISEPDITLYFNGFQKYIGMIYENSYEWTVQNAFRTIRVLLRMQCQESGDIFLHGGFIKYKEKGICILGEKKAGKTSLILSMMKFCKADFISNDDVSLHLENDTWIGEGWPRSIVVRDDTWKRLQDKDMNLSHPLNTVSDRMCFYPHELCKIFQVQLLYSTPIEYVIFPQFSTSSICLNEINKESAEKLIKHYILDNPGKYNDYLFPFFSKTAQNKIWDIFISKKKIHCIELKQSFDNLYAGAALLKKYIDKE